MKKLLIVALMALLAAGAFAQEVKFGGQIEYETSSSLKANGTTANAKENYGLYDADVTLIANITADEYNTGVLRIHKQTGDRRLSWLDRAHFTTDVGKFFGLPIGWKSQVGLNDWSFAPSGNAKWDTLFRIISKQGSDANPGDATIGDYNDYFFDARIWGIKESFVIDALTINAFFSLNGNALGADREDDFGPGASNNAGYNKLRDLYVHAKYAQKAGSGNLGVDVAYMLWTGSGNQNVTRQWTGHDKGFGFGDGTVLFALGYTGIGLAPDMTLDFGAAWYQALSKASFSGYGANVQLNLAKTLYAVVGLQGYLDGNKEGGWGTSSDNTIRVFKGEVLHNIRVGAGVSPVPFLSIDAGVLLYMGDEKILDKDGITADRKMLNTLDISAALKVGKMDYRIGYMLVPDNDRSIDPFAGGDGGVDTSRKSLYFKAKLGF